MSAHLTPAIARRVYGAGDELSTFATWRRSAYFEFKDVPVKNKVYRYWYLRYSDAGAMRSIYCGKVKPEISARQAIDAIAAGYDPKALDRASLNRPAPGPELPKNAPGSTQAAAAAPAPASPASSSSEPARSSSSSRRSPARSSPRKGAGLGSRDRARSRRSPLPKPPRRGRGRR